MRPYKENVGLPITNAKASYTELAGKLKPLEKPPTKAAPNGILSSVAKALFSKPGPTAATKPGETPAGSFNATQEAKAAPSVTAKEEPHPPSPESEAALHAESSKPRIELEQPAQPTKTNLQPISILASKQAASSAPDKPSAPAAQDPDSNPNPHLSDPSELTASETAAPAKLAPPKTPRATPNFAPNLGGPKPLVLDLTQSGTDLSKILDDMIGDTQISFESVKEDDDSASVAAAPEDSFFREYVNNKEEPEEETSVLSLADAEDPNSAAAEAIDNKELPVIKALEPAQEVNGPPQLNAAASYFEMLPVSNPNDPTAPFFSAAFADVQDSNELEFSGELFSSRLSASEAKLYFDLAFEALSNPESEKKYVSEIAISEKMKVEAESVQEQLNKLEQRMSTRHITLKGETARAHATADTNAQIEVLAAPWRLRLIAASTDLLVALFLAVVTALILFAYNSPELAQVISGSKRIDDFMIIDFTLYGSLAFLFWWIFFPLGQLLTTRTTSGLEKAKLKLVTGNGREPHKRQYVVRSICYPLSVPLLGFLLPMFRRNPFHDWVAGLMTTNKES